MLQPLNPHFFPRIILLVLWVFFVCLFLLVVGFFFFFIIDDKVHWHYENHIFNTVIAVMDILQSPSITEGCQLSSLFFNCVYEWTCWNISLLTIWYILTCKRFSRILTVEIISTVQCENKILGQTLAYWDLTSKGKSSLHDNYEQVTLAELKLL